MDKDQQFKQESELTKGESVMVLTITLDTFLQSNLQILG